MAGLRGLADEAVSGRTEPRVTVGCTFSLRSMGRARRTVDRSEAPVNQPRCCARYLTPGTAAGPPDGFAPPLRFIQRDLQGPRIKVILGARKTVMISYTAAIISRSVRMGGTLPDD